MNFSEFMHIISHSLLDGFKVFIVVLICYIILSFLETRISKKLDKENRYAPAFGALSGIIPQCGISVVAADLYLKEHISMGTLLAVFIACSDEALPILLADSQKFMMVFPIIINKLILAFIVGFTIDLIYKKSQDHVHEHKEHCEHEEVVHIGCCHHEIDNENENKISKHFIHPLLHSLKIFAYVVLIYIVFEILFVLIGENNISVFLQANKYLSPLMTVIIGLIPNCSSSIIISELYLQNAIGFGATLSGLCVSAGLGLLFLLKNKTQKKKALTIITILIIVSLIIGYLSSLILQFK